MTASDRVVAHRYAKALFEAAGGEGEQVRRELAEAYRQLAPRLELLKNPTVALAAKKEFVAKTIGAASSLTANFIKLLIDKKRIQLLAVIVSDFGRLLDEKAGRVRAQVRSASDLSPQELELLAKRLKAVAGKDVVVEAKTDPELIGGIIVRMGDAVLDGSIQGQLRQLKARLIEA